MGAATAAPPHRLDRRSGHAASPRRLCTSSSPQTGRSTTATSWGRLLTPRPPRLPLRLDPPPTLTISTVPPSVLLLSQHTQGLEHLAARQLPRRRTGHPGTSARGRAPGRVARGVRLVVPEDVEVGVKAGADAREVGVVEILRGHDSGILRGATPNRPQVEQKSSPDEPPMDPQSDSNSTASRPLIDCTAGPERPQTDLGFVWGALLWRFSVRWRNGRRSAT